MISSEMINTGLCVKNFRKSQNMSQAEFGKIAGVSNKTISAWEKGKRKINFKYVRNILEKFDVDINDFLSSIDDSRENCFYICKVCGNVIFAGKEARVNCCGLDIYSSHRENYEEESQLKVETDKKIVYVTIEHEMTNRHYLRFVAYVSGKNSSIRRLKPQENGILSFIYTGPGKVYSYCTRHGLCSKFID